MNTRVLELIKNPRSISESDLKILESESEKMPYAQSIRALYLYGINLYQSENYKENLSKTAAYTTDKKILYQFINSEKISKKEEPSEYNNIETVDLPAENPTSELAEPAESKIVSEIENSDNKEDTSLNKFDVEKIIESEIVENPEFVIVNGEKNRLLYEGEENFLEQKTPEVDLEATKESGHLTLKEETENIASQISIDDNRSEESISTEKDIEDAEEVLEKSDKEIFLEENNSQQETSSNDISFGGIQDFLPEVKFSVPKNHLDYLNPPKTEKKIEKPVEISIEKSNVFVEKIPEKELEIKDSHEISFENAQAFEISKAEKAETENQIPEENKISLEKTQSLEAVEVKTEELTKSKNEIRISEIKTEKTEPTTKWKPMSFSTNIPDALIGKRLELDVPKKIIEKEEVKEMIAPTEEKIAGNAESKSPESERPVFNVSFFGNEVSKIEEKKETHITEEKVVEENNEKASNVGTFINTWQSWLKIDRQETKAEPSKAKEKIIDNFIENNPKISQLKEESSYVVKEKKDDISHLMTETLARLYTEQKLYSKAIKAYEILAEKHPQKKDHFKEKIEEVKNLRKP